MYVNIITTGGEKMFTMQEIESLSDYEYTLSQVVRANQSWDTTLSFTCRDITIHIEVKDCRSKKNHIHFYWHNVNNYDDNTRIEMTKKVKILEHIIKSRDKDRLKMILQDHDIFVYDAMFIQHLEQYEQRKNDYQFNVVRRSLEDMQFYVKLILPPQMYVPECPDVEEARFVGEDAAYLVKDLAQMQWGTFSEITNNTYIFTPKNEWHNWQYVYIVKEFKKIGYSMVLIEK